MKTNWKIKDFVIVAIIGVIFGLFFFAVDALYLLLYPVLGDVMINVLFGVYCLSALVPITLIKKFGAGFLGSVVTAVVNILAGSPYGINILVAGALQGIGVEIGFFKKSENKWMPYVISGIAMTIIVTIRDYFVFGLNMLPVGILVAVIAVRLISAIVIGGIIAYAIDLGLQKTGVLKES